MTATLPAADAARTARDVSTLSFMLSLVTPDSDTARRIRDLGDELDEIHADYAMALRMCRENTEQWRRELEAQEVQTRAELRHVAGLDR